MNNKIGLISAYAFALAPSMPDICLFGGGQNQIGRSMKQDAKDKSVFVDAYGKKYKQDAKGTMRRFDN